MGESRVVIPIFGILDVTGEVIGMWVILAAVTVISLLATRHMRERPGKFQNVIETGVEYLDNYFAGILGKRVPKTSSVSRLALRFHHFRQLHRAHPRRRSDRLLESADLVAFGNAWSQHHHVFLPAGLKHPCARLSAISSALFPHRDHAAAAPSDEFIKPASLALRLFGNIFGEETVTEQLYEILPIGAPIVMMVLSLLFCALQAIVFYDARFHLSAGGHRITARL